MMEDKSMGQYKEIGLVPEAVAKAGKQTRFIDTEFGRMGISERCGFITALFLTKDTKGKAVGADTPVLLAAEKQIREYLAGLRQTFDLPLSPAGTEFQKMIWAALQRIPYGETCSYQQVAAMVGKPNACRAVGMANNKNPILIIIPCHRVIGSNGKLVGYAAGLAVKEKLLELERAH